MNNPYENRLFQHPDDAITGRSVIIENARKDICPINSSPVWPYDLSDYLRSLVGKQIQVKYLINGRYCEKQGKLVVSGANFMGVQPSTTKDLFIIELSMVRCINVMNYHNP
jgi:hypothetical protein